MCRSKQPRDSEWRCPAASDHGGNKLLDEYQYYEFQAIDRPLDEADRKALGKLSTRARITRTSLTVHYDWGDFKGDPNELMRRWFGLHVYVGYGVRKINRNRERDIDSQSALSEDGWRVLTIWECETKNLLVFRKRLRTFLDSQDA